MKKLSVIFALFFYARSYSQVYIPSEDATNYGLILKEYNEYFDSLSDLGIVLDSIFVYREFLRTQYALQYNGNYPNFTYEQLAADNNNWITANAGNWGCKINSQYPFLSFNEVGPVKHSESPLLGVGASNKRLSGTGQIHYITYDHLDTNRMFACTNYGGLFRSYDGGSTWSQAGTDQGLPNTSVSSIAFGAANENIWFLSTGNAEAYDNRGIVLPAIGIWRTMNGGISYQRITGAGFGPGGADLDNAIRIRKIIAVENESTTRLIVVSSNGVFSCEDGEAISPVWKEIYDGDYYDVEFKPDNQDIIYATGDKDAPLISYNFDSSTLSVLHSLNLFFEFNLEEGDRRRTSIEFCSEVANELFLVMTELDADSLGVSGVNRSTLVKYKTTTGSMVLKGNLPSTDYIEYGHGVGLGRHMGWDVSNRLVDGKIQMVYGNVGQIRITDDLLNDSTLTTLNWVTIMQSQIHDDQHYMKFSQNSKSLIVGNDGGIYKTTLLEPTINYTSYAWQEKNKGLSVGMPISASTSQNGERILMGSFQDMGNRYYETDSLGFWDCYGVLFGDGTEDFVNMFNSDYMLGTNQASIGSFTNDRWDTRIPFSAPISDAEAFKKIKGNTRDQEILYSCTKIGLKKFNHGSNSFELYSNLPIEASITPENGYLKPQNVYEVWTSENPQFSDYIYVFWRGGNSNLDATINPDVINPRIYRSKIGGGLDPTDWELVYQFSEPEFGVLAIKYDDPNVFWVSEGDSLFKVDLNSPLPADRRQNYTDGLPNLSYSAIRDIAYVNGSGDDAMYVGTKHGLYYRDNTNYPTGFVHVCGIPNTPIYDLEIDFCLQKLIVATYGRGLWEANIEIPVTSPLIITENTTIDYHHFSSTDIIIQNGTLTIKDTLFMASGTRIVVKKGARLKVDGGMITNECGRFWKGIQVEGDKDLAQNATNQGVVTLLNGAIIQHAEVGVALWIPGDWTTTGGILYASASTFKDNRKDVEFMQYSNHNEYGVLPNQSSLTNMTFTWTDDFKSQFPLGHVTLYKVEGVRFTGCHFKDDRTNPDSRYKFDDGKTNSGIYSIDANYSIVPGCSAMAGCIGSIEDDPNWQPTTFDNLDFGVYVANISSESNIIVDRASFTNNLYGVQTVNVNNPIVTRSNFQFTNAGNNFEEYMSYGIHLVSSNSLSVQENSIKNISSAGEVTGIVSSDLGESDEVLYKNKFTDLQYGLIAQGKNRGVSEIGIEKGLQIICDSNYNNAKDHLVLGTLWGGESSLYGVKAFNGLATAPSGTVFSIDDFTSSGLHYTNESANGVTYFFNVDSVSQHPSNYSGIFNPLGININNQCLSNLSNSPFHNYTSGFMATTLSDLNTYSTALNEKLTTYLGLVNGGDTEALLTTIAALTVNNKDTLHALLMSLSPYLTEEVLRATLNHPITKYPTVWAYQLVEANIEVAYKTGFIDFLATKTNPLTPQMVADIQSLLDSNASTAMLIKQLEIADLQTKKATASNLLIQSLKNDTVQLNLDSIRVLIELKGDVLVKTRVVDTYLQEGNYTAASGVLSIMDSDIQNYPAHLRNEILDYISFKQKIINLFENDIPLDSLSETDYSFMTNLAENGTGLARYQAQELLCFFYGECAEYPVIVQTQQSLSPFFNKDEKALYFEKRSFKIYPNPAQSWIAIELPKVDSPLAITVVDLTGRFIYQKESSGINGTTRLNAVEIWDTHLIGDGVYLITITDVLNGENFGTQRVVIQH